MTVNFFFWSDKTKVSIYRRPEENIAYELVFTPPAVSILSSIRFLDDLLDWR